MNNVVLNDLVRQKTLSKFHYSLWFYFAEASTVKPASLACGQGHLLNPRHDLIPKGQGNLFCFEQKLQDSCSLNRHTADSLISYDVP